MRPNILDWISLALVVVGALNWGLVGLFHFNLVTYIFGGVPLVESIIYVLVGLAGLWTIYGAARMGSRQGTMA